MVSYVEKDLVLLLYVVISRNPSTSLQVTLIASFVHPFRSWKQDADG